MKKEIKNSPNSNKINKRIYKKVCEIICATVMTILTMPSIAVCLMFQRCNLYIKKLNHMLQLNLKQKHFATDHFELLIKKEKKYFVIGLFFLCFYLF